jgi:hypothetical protein
LDFFTTHQSPIAITIDGKAYMLPRFLNPALKQWSALLRKQQADLATEHLDADQKARFLTYFQPPAIDIAEMLQTARAAEGADYVVRSQMQAAQVPGELIDNILSNADPMLIRNLAMELTQAPQTLAKLGAEEKPDPLPQPAGASGDSPATGQETAPVTSPSTT